MSGTDSSSVMSAIASTSIASIPSVPLMSARPSFSASATGSQADGAQRVAGAGARPTASRTNPSPVIASAQWASGARSPEQPSEPCSWTTGVRPALSISA